MLWVTLIRILYLHQVSSISVVPVGISLLNYKANMPSILRFFKITFSMPPWNICFCVLLILAWTHKTKHGKSLAEMQIQVIFEMLKGAKHLSSAGTWWRRFVHFLWWANVMLPALLLSLDCGRASVKNVLHKMRESMQHSLRGVGLKVLVKLYTEASVIQGVHDPLWHVNMAVTSTRKKSNWKIKNLKNIWNFKTPPNVECVSFKGVKKYLQNFIYLFIYF